MTEQDEQRKKITMIIGLDLPTLAHLVELYLNARLMKVLTDVSSMGQDKLAGEWEYKAHLKWNGGQSIMRIDGQFLTTILQWALNGMYLAGNMMPALVVSVLHRSHFQAPAGMAESAVVFVTLQTTSLGREGQGDGQEPQGEEPDTV